MLRIFLGVLFGITDYGWYFYQRFALSAAVRDGIRSGVTNLSDPSPPTPTAPTPPDAWSIAKSRAQAVLQQSNTIDYTRVTFGPTAGNQYTSTTTKRPADQGHDAQRPSYTFMPLIGFVLLPHDRRCIYSMTMMLEQEN